MAWRGARLGRRAGLSGSFSTFPPWDTVTRMFSLLQFLVVAAIAYSAFVGGVWALIDAARRPAEAFVNAGKQT